VNSNVLPASTAELALIRPPWRSTMRRTFASPTPVPRTHRSNVGAGTLVRVAHVEADAVVAYAEDRFAGSVVARDRDLDALAWACVLERVIDQVSPHLLEQRAIGETRAERRHFEVDVRRIADELRDDGADQRVDIDDTEPERVTSELRERQQIIDQLAEADAPLRTRSRSPRASSESESP
jgi:hypothetical protein